MDLACCGLDCSACPQMNGECDGCHADSGRLWSADCRIRVCCKQEKGHSDCSECASFACQTIQDFENDKYAHHTEAVGRLRERRLGAAPDNG